MPRNFSDTTVKQLYASSGGHCAICKSSLFLKASDGTPVQVGEIAHIYPFGQKGAPRFDEIALDGFDETKKDMYENLILLCPKCHTEIDKISQDYPAKKLIQIKSEHEEWVKKRLEKSTSDLTFVEIEAVCDFLINHSDYFISSSSSDFSVIGILPKIQKNSLSKRVSNRLEMGLSRAYLLDSFINAQPNVYFSEKLLNTIKNMYKKLSGEFSGDDLYNALLDEINKGSEDNFDRQAAGNVIISYFFHICEIFEK